MKLLKGYLNFFDCGDNKKPFAREVAKWDSADLEAAMAKAGLPACRAFTREQWLAHPQGGGLSRVPGYRRDMLITMNRRRALLLSLSVPGFAQIRSLDEAQGSPVQWKPHPVFNGAPVLFISKTFSGPANWLGKTIEFRPDGDAFSALAGVNLNRTPGHYPLAFGAETVEVTVTDRKYPSSTITVPPKFVEPPKEVQARIDEEIAIKQKAFESSPPARLWQGPFVAPVNTAYTSSFGARRVYNGKTRSVHQGLDYSAAMGTPVKAANSGRVSIARDMYFEGGLVVIDHGESIFTLYMHLSEILVTDGAAIDKGALLAKSGSSGRVTGPHLHFGVRWQGAYLEPSTLLRLWRGGAA
jgi:murein DD-endopeptidase MepM/ murein hydrolase activator NlpD